MQESKFIALVNGVFIHREGRANIKNAYSTLQHITVTSSAAKLYHHFFLNFCCVRCVKSPIAFAINLRFICIYISVLSPVLVIGQGSLVNRSMVTRPLIDKYVKTLTSMGM